MTGEPATFWRDGVHHLVGKSEKIMNTNRKYITSQFFVAEIKTIYKNFVTILFNRFN